MNEASNEFTDENNTCCGGPASTNTQACCREDELAKNAGEEGCGCSEKNDKAPEAKSCCH